MAPISSTQWASDVSSHYLELGYKQNENVGVENNSGKYTKKMTYYTLPYNGNTLKFTIDEFGTRPKTGYALYIALHGGGRITTERNNGLWYDMATALYRYSFKGADPKHNGTVDGAIYVALRGVAPQGVADDWDLHFRPESYVLLERLIMILLRPAGTPPVDSNRIFLVGFSAGGDGVYRLATNLSDRFAAVNMSAGHPGNNDGDLN
jgi:predicted peptidase